MIGSVLDKYEILQKIGDGGMATVYRGRHVTLGRDVAIKVLHPHLSASPRNRQRFAREARAIEHLDHDNILQIFDYSGTQTEDCFIVTEFVDGVTLQQLVADRGRLPSEVAAIIGIDLAKALSYAHDLGIIHRDLKPENVMVRRDGTVKLMDFGIARFLDEVNLTMTGALVGSPAYMSPEQAMERVLDPRSDLFSMGTLLFHLVTGQLPFAGNNPSIILRNIIEGKRPELMDLAPDASGSMADIIERMLSTDPGGRPQNAEEVRVACERSLREVDIAPGDPQWTLQAWLTDPEGFQARLDAHLTRVLMTRGRARLDDRDHLGALQLFNRLLVLDEENHEVLALVQDMHGMPADTGRSRRWGLLGLALVAATALLTWLLWPEPPGATPDLAQSPNIAETSVAAGPATPGPGAEPSAAELVAAATEIEPPATTADRSPADPEPPTPPSAVKILRRPERTAARAPLERESDAIDPMPAADQAHVTISVSNSASIPGAWARIFVDGEYKGVTGDVDPIPVSPGSHEIRLINPYAEPIKQGFEVHAGERKNLEFTLQRKPSYVRVGEEIDGACTVWLDGKDMGTVDANVRQVRVSEPERSHELLFRCPNGTEIGQKLQPQGFDKVVKVP